MWQEVVALVDAHEAADGLERAHVEAILALLGHREQATHRDHWVPGHITASAFVLSSDAEKVLLIHHSKLGLWLQPGGHIDEGDRSLADAVLREVQEETGLTDVTVLPGFPHLLDVDVHEIPARPAKGEPAHRHFDLRLALQAHDDHAVAGSDALAVRWVSWDELEGVHTDASVMRAARRLRARVRGWAAAEHQQHYPATLRNREPILEVLRGLVGAGDAVLEVASGSGEHAEWLAPRLGVSHWQVTDASTEAMPGLWSRAAASGGIVRLPARLDVLSGPWPPGTFDVVWCANMVHIAPWACTPALFDGASSVLGPTGRVVLYGPFSVDGRHTAASNASFDASLRARDPRWGVRDLGAVIAAAAAAGFRLAQSVQMPANNQVLVFERTDAPRRDPA